MSTPPRYRFGNYQPFMSDKLKENPKMAKIVSNIFGYTNLGTWGRYLIFKDLIQILPMVNMKSIMDLGCGQGEFSFMLADALPNVQIDATDTDVAAMKKMNEVINKFKIKNLQTYTCMIQDLGSEKNEYYDMIFSIDVFQHIPVDQMPFQACKQRLKAGGYLITKMPAKDHLRILPKSLFKKFDDTLAGKNPDHVYMAHLGQVYSLDDLVKRYEKEGFKVIAAFYSDGIIARAGWEFNYLMTRAGSVTQLLSLPLSKMLMWLDKIVQNRKNGNVIQVIGQKI